MAELLTEKEKERRQRDMKVAEAYRLMRAKYPGAAPSRIMKAMAEKGVCGLTSYCGVRSSLVRSGVTTTR